MKTNDILMIVGVIAILAISIICHTKSKALRQQYNIGCIVSYLFTAGIIGVVLIIVSAVFPEVRAELFGNAESAGEYLLIAAACLALAVGMFFLAYHKAPAERKSVINVILTMLVVGLGFAWAIALGFFKLIAKVFFHANFNGSSGG